MQTSMYIEINTVATDLDRIKGKAKVVPVLLFTEHHAMKAYRGVEV